MGTMGRNVFEFLALNDQTFLPSPTVSVIKPADYWAGSLGLRLKGLF